MGSRMPARTKPIPHSTRRGGAFDLAGAISFAADAAGRPAHDWTPGGPCGPGRRPQPVLGRPTRRRRSFRSPSAWVARGACRTATMTMPSPRGGGPSCVAQTEHSPKPPTTSGNALPPGRLYHLKAGGLASPGSGRDRPPDRGPPVPRMARLARWLDPMFLAALRSAWRDKPHCLQRNSPRLERLALSRCPSLHACPDVGQVLEDQDSTGLHRPDQAMASTSRQRRRPRNSAREVTAGHATPRSTPTTSPVGWTCGPGLGPRRAVKADPCGLSRGRTNG